MADIGMLYAQGRARISQLVGDAGDAARSTTVPTCPEWTVHDVVSHLAGVCTDIIEGTLEGVATDPWTARQVDARRDTPTRDVLREWAASASMLEPAAERLMGPAAPQWLSDMTTHEHDIRTALSAPGERDAESVRVAFRWLSAALGNSFQPPMRVLTPEGDELRFGEGDPAVTLRAPRFELFRAFTGRRSEDQIAAFDWQGDYRTVRHAFERGPFHIADAPVLE